MPDAFPVLSLSDEQLSLLAAQLLIYQHYLQRKVAPSTERTCALQVLSALLPRLSEMVIRRDSPRALLLAVEEALLIKEALTILQQLLEARPSSAERDQEIVRMETMRTLVEQTFPLTQD